MENFLLPVFELLASQLFGKSEKQLTSTDCRPTDNQQFTDRSLTDHRQITDSRLKKKYYTETYDKITGKTKVSNMIHDEKGITSFAFNPL